MRHLAIFLTLGVLSLAGCTVGTGLQNIAQECRSEDADTLAAEYPDAATVSQHDLLEQEAASLNQQAEKAVQATDNPDAGSADIGQSVQDSEDADGLYNYQERQQTASECWAMLADLAGTEQVQWVQLQEQNSEDAAAAQAQSAATAEDSPPPPTPSPIPPPNVSTPQQPQPTWMDTPYAPIIPPVLRGEPVGTGGTAIPLIAQ